MNSMYRREVMVSENRNMTTKLLL